jgi:hypothetical protein
MKQPTQGSILLALSKGHFLTLERINDLPDGTHDIYRLSSTSQAVRKELVDEMLANGLIRPNEDGLPGLGAPSQTYSMVRSSDGPRA